MENTGTQFIGKYEVIATLGRGSMGVVYKARDPEIGRVVAIKTLRSVFMGEDAAGNEALQRFRQESRSAGRLQHPNIVTIFEAGRTDNGSPYIVMEFIDGYSLEALSAQRAPLDPLEVLHYLAQVASAIDYAHRQNVIHRDIKPSNIIVDAFYRPHLLDFGVAKLSDTSLTPAGTVVGTPSYMSPEQIRGETLDGASDRFAFAVVAFELFTGTRPFPGQDFTTVVSNIINKEPLTLAQANAERLPASLGSVLHRGLSKTKTERYPTALEFVDALAKTVGATIDGMGLVGGYNPQMKWQSKGPAVVAAAPDPARTEAFVGPQAPAPTAAPATSEGYGLTKLTAFAVALILLAGAGGYLMLGAVLPQRNTPRPSAPKAAIKQPASVEQSESAKLETQRMVNEQVKAVTPPQPKSEAELPGLSDTQLASFLRSEEAQPALLRAAVEEVSRRGNAALAGDAAQAARHEDFRIKIDVIKLLGKPPFNGSPAARESLISLLSDKDPLVRGFAAKFLSPWSGDEGLRALNDRAAVESDQRALSPMRQSIAQIEAELKK